MIHLKYLTNNKHSLCYYCCCYYSVWIIEDICSLEKSYDQPRQHIKKQRHYFANKSPFSQSYGFSSSHVWM